MVVTTVATRAGVTHFGGDEVGNVRRSQAVWQLLVTYIWPCNEILWSSHFDELLATTDWMLGDGPIWEGAGACLSVDVYDSFQSKMQDLPLS